MGKEIKSTHFIWCLFMLSYFLAEDTFQSMQEEFMTKHCDHFEVGDENKLVYTEVFEGYVSSHRPSSGITVLGSLQCLVVSF